MANFHFQITSISRGDDRSAVAAAAYRSGERIRDERTGRLHNYSRRIDVLHKEILLPAGFDAGQIPWVKDRTKLWNAAESVERPRNARVAREFQVGLPHELPAPQRLDLARTFSQELADRYHVVVDLAIHAPKTRAGGDPRNHHAHLLLSSREITATGFGAKAGLDMDANGFRRLGLPVGIAEIKAMRERWATLTNDALKTAGLDVRVDHRSLKAQGIERSPKHRHYIDIMRERRELRRQKVEDIRDKHMQRVEARRDQAPQVLIEEPAKESAVDRIQRLAREKWAQLKGDLSQSRATERDNDRGQERGNDQSATTPDKDHAL